VKKGQNWKPIVSRIVKTKKEPFPNQFYGEMNGEGIWRVLLE
jgi:hypothetical protein